MKKLFQISENLKKNGIKGKEHDQYFKRDELLVLKDYEFLVQKGENLWSYEFIVFLILFFIFKLINYF